MVLLKMLLLLLLLLLRASHHQEWINKILTRRRHGIPDYWIVIIIIVIIVIIWITISSTTAIVRVLSCLPSSKRRRMLLFIDILIRKKIDVLLRRSGVGKVELLLTRVREEGLVALRVDVFARIRRHVQQRNIRRRLVHHHHRRLFESTIWLLSRCCSDGGHIRFNVRECWHCLQWLLRMWVILQVLPWRLLLLLRLMLVHEHSRTRMHHHHCIVDGGHSSCCGRAFLFFEGRVEFEKRVREWQAKFLKRFREGRVQESVVFFEEFHLTFKRFFFEQNHLVLFVDAVRVDFNRYLPTTSFGVRELPHEHVDSIVDFFAVLLRCACHAWVQIEIRHFSHHCRFTSLSTKTWCSTVSWIHGVCFACCRCTFCESNWTCTCETGRDVRERV